MASMQMTPNTSCLFQQIIGQQVLIDPLKPAHEGYKAAFLWQKRRRSGFLLNLVLDWFGWLPFHSVPGLPLSGIRRKNWTTFIPLRFIGAVPMGLTSKHL